MKKMKKPEKGKQQQQIGKSQEEHMPQSSPSTPLCAILQLAQLKILSPLLTLKIDLKKKFPPPHK
jgi:hypothetical protein